MRLLAYILAWAVAVAGFHTLASAQGGSATKPVFTRKWQGDTRDFKEVSCSNTASTALVSASELANAMSMYVYNTDGANYVTLCPRGSAAGGCTGASRGLTLLKQDGFTSDVSVPGDWTCLGDTGAVVVEVYIERDYGTSPDPTPTPIATPTPTPT